MKWTLLIISFFAAASYAGEIENSLNTQISGRVVLERNQSMTCLATNCPPSLPYYQLVLDDAEVAGIGPVDAVIFQDFAPVLVDQKPEAVTYAGVTLTEGRYIFLEAEVRLNQYGGKTYVFVTNPVSIKFAPIRSPVMIY